MARNPSMAAAEKAVAWASDLRADGPGRTNYAQLLEDVLRACGRTDAGTPIVTQLPGLAAAHWPCLSRMLVMDEPELIERIHPHLDPALDSQAGVTWLQLQFAAVTGRRPAVRSWRHAPRRGCASL